VEGSDMFLNILGWDGTDPVTYPSAPLYSIHLDQSGTYTSLPSLRDTGPRFR